MEGLINGINDICSVLTKVAGALLVLTLIIAGIESFIGGEEGHMKLKKSIKYIIIGAGITFGASVIAPEIISWFS